MKNCLLSIDWDYFIHSPLYSWGIYLENEKNLIDIWYKRYIQAKARGEDLQNAFWLSPELNTFWHKIKKRFKFVQDIKVYVSDSHALSYKIAIAHSCKTVFMFDSHADLGYGGLSSLEFEVNCSNWLGKLLKNQHIKAANIIYGPYAEETAEQFSSLNRIYNIKYPSLKDLNQTVTISALHICRSGAWTPPWMDDEFFNFINALDLPYKITNCSHRNWDVTNLTLSDRINYLLA